MLRRVARRLGDAGSDEDAVEPGVEAVRIAEPGQVAPGDHQRLLHGILGPIDVAEDALRDREEAVATGADQVGVRLPVPASCGLHEIAIHPRRSSSTPIGGAFQHLMGVPTASSVHSSSRGDLDRRYSESRAGASRRRPARSRSMKGGPPSSGAGEVVMDLGVGGGMEQRSSLYGLLWWKDKVGWEAAPAAQFHTGVVKRPARSRGLPGRRVRSS